VEELTGMLPLHEAIPLAADRLDAVIFREWKRSLILELAGIVRGLHARRWFHKDLYFCHFYIAEEDTRTLPLWNGRVQMIDLHRLGHHPWTWPWWLAKDLAQLLYSSAVAGVTPRDRLAFWRAYSGHAGQGLKDRFLRRFIRVRAERYARHNRQAA
jgi:heptose I phosphotransferase